ncbi:MULTISPECIES: hypothetical protein [unclassified Bartonella]
MNIAIKHAAALGIDVDMQLVAKALLENFIQNTQNIPVMPWKEMPKFFQS